MHLRKVDDLPQRFIMGRRVAAAPGAESDGKRSLIGNIFITDLQGRRQILQRLKSHVEGSLPVILVHPVPKFTAAEPEGIKVVLPGDLHAVSVIRPGAPHMGELGRHKPRLSAFAAPFCQRLHPFQGGLPRFKVCLQDGIALRHIIGVRFPVIIFGISILPVVEMDRIALRHLLVFGNAKLFLLRFLCEVPLKMRGRVNHQGIGQLVCNGRVLPALFRRLVMDAAAPALHLFQISVFHKETVIGLHCVLHGAHLRDRALQLPYRLDIFFLSCKALFRRVVPAVILRGGIQPVPRLFDKIDHAKGNPVIKHGRIIRFLPDIIFFYEFLGFTLIHGVQIVHIEPPVLP